MQLLLRNIKPFSEFILFGFLLVLLNVVSSYYFIKLDFTEEKRYTLSQNTENLLKDISDPILIQVLLEGEFPPGFKRLQGAVKEMLSEFQSLHPELQYVFEDPMEGNQEDVNQFLKNLASVGIVPTELQVKEKNELIKKNIYPFAILYYGDRQIAIPLLENETPGIPPELALNNSVSLLEFKFVSAISKLIDTQRKNILFTQGHGELLPLQTADLQKNLSAFYNIGPINLDSVYQIPSNIALVILAKPVEPFTEKEKFVLDQYIMNGGNVFFLIDPLVISLDSIQKHGTYVPFNNDLNLDDLFFKYGFRIQPNLILDLECTSIPLIVGKVGSKNQFDLKPWFYHVLAGPASDHAIVKGLDRVNLRFPASIDTVKTKTQVRKIPLLSSSTYTRLQYTPVILDFEIAKIPLDPAKFNKPPQTLAMLLEGPFTSLFANRVEPAFLQTLDQINTPFKSQAEDAKILVVADGDIAKNLINPATGEFRELGYNQYTRYTYDNKNFLVNAIEYMLDSRGLFEARAKEVKLRLLDKPRINKEKSKWQLINVVLPLLVLIVFGILFNGLRKYKYARS